MAEEGLNPEQLRRMTEAVERMAEAFRGLSDPVEAFRQYAEVLVEGEIGREVDLFSSRLSNMTDAQIRREFFGEE